MANIMGMPGINVVNGNNQKKPGSVSNAAPSGAFTPVDFGFNPNDFTQKLQTQADALPYTPPSAPVYDPAAAAAAKAEAMTAAARDATQKSIDSLDTVLNNNLGSISDRFNKINSQYAEEEALNKNRFGEQTSANENNRTNSIQQALLAAAQGGRGLMASLAALGALGGDGSLLARRAVSQEANRDIGDGNRVFDTNATQLNQAWDSTQADQKRRRQEAADAKVNEERAARSKIAETRQSLFEKMANLWGTSGNTGEAARFLGMVGEQAPIIAANSATQVSPYSARNIGFEAGQLKSYLAGRNDMSVKAAPQAGGSNAVNSPLFSLTRKREESL